MFESLVVKAKEAEEDAEKASGTGTLLALVPPDLHNSHSHDNGTVDTTGRYIRHYLRGEYDCIIMILHNMNNN